MTFPVRFLDEIRARVALAQVIGQSVKLTRKGREYSGLCPFHNEKSPSFTVNEDKGFFHCLAAETGVILRDGVRPIGTLAGTVQTILTRGGVWVDAAFKSYGIQRLHRITLTRNGQSKTIHATSGHRWFVRGVLRDVLTYELRRGHRLESVLPQAREAWILDPAGVAHGEEARRRFEAARKSFSRLRWVVSSVEETDREEEVYCADVPGEHAFAIEDNILTGNCFGCGAHGDVITFLMRSRHMSFPDAVEQLAGQAGLDLPEQTPQDREREKRAAGLHDITEAAALWFEEQLWAPGGKAALAYLRDRGLTDDTIRRFRLGWSPETRTGLKTALNAMARRSPGSSQASSQSDERVEWRAGDMLAVEAGLLIKPEEGGESFDRFRGRVMFPITDRRGRVIAFGGRLMGDGQPKYLNSPETPLFHKGHTLYGWALAREAAAKTGTLLVAEGYMDVIALHQAGFSHAVAPLGTALTEEQIALMWRDVAEPILCLDGDAAGQRAAIRAAERALTILKPGRSLRFATLPAPEDPDSLIKKSGPAAMRAVCDQAVSLSDTLWRVKFQTQPIATPEQRAGVEQQIRQSLSVIPDQGLQRDYVFDFIRRLRDASRSPGKPRAPWQPSFGGRPPGSRARTYATRDAQGRVIVTGHKASPVLKPARENLERQLLMIPLARPGLLDEIVERLGEIPFADSNLDKLRQEVVLHAHHCASLDRQAMHDYLRSRGFSQTLDCLLEASAHDYTPLTKPDISVEEVRPFWEHVYGRYRQKDWAADVEQAKQRSAADLTDETFGFFSALWSGRDRGGDL